MACSVSERRRLQSFALLALLALAGNPALAAPPTLVPAPQSLKTAAGACALGELTYSYRGPLPPPVRYALGVLAAALGPTGKRVPPAAAAIRLSLATSPAELAAAAARVRLGPAPPDRQREAYVLDCGLGDRSRIVLTGGPVGLIYGVHTLAQLAAQGDPRRLPRLAISDWPSFLTRAWTGVPRNPADPECARLLDWFARWRINACYYEIYGDEGQDGAPPEVARLQRECARRGITLYGQISNWRTNLLLKRELCPCNPEDLAHIRRYCNELLDRGCEGLIFLFDDLTQAAVEHPLTCPLCKARFSGLAAAQLELIRPMVEVARQRHVQRLLVCPTPYYRGWQDSYDHKLPGQAYFAVWGQSDLMKEVQVFHCLLREPELAEVQRAGLRNFVYWYNGNRDYEACAPGGQPVPGLWAGFTELAFGWYGYRWDATRGVVPLADTGDAFRRLPALTQHAWLCGGGDYPFALWGAYCWNAEHFDPAATERDLLRSLYGATAPADYARWRDLVRKWYPRLLAPPTDLPDGARAAYLQELTADADTAKQAAQAFGAGKRSGAAEDIAPRLLASAETLAQTAAGATSGQATVRLADWTEQKTGQATQRERRMEIGNFWSRYVLRYSQTTEPNGAKHRSQWHFGSGLGMLGPSYRNWYDGGFFDVILNGQSLDTMSPEFAVAGDTLVASWDTPEGKLTVSFSLHEGGLKLDGRLAGGPDAALSLRLFAIPGAGQGGWTDMDKVVITAEGETPHGTPVALRPGDDWLFLADRTYDLPHENAEGPCAVRFAKPLPAIRCDNGSYVVQVDADYPAGTRQFSLTVWDFHGQQNAAALSAFRALSDRLTP
jgi:hypothetical protein